MQTLTLLLFLPCDDRSSVMLWTFGTHRSFHGEPRKSVPLEQNLSKSVGCRLAVHVSRKTYPSPPLTNAFWLTLAHHCRREAAFICNLDLHWYTLRRFGPSTQRWYDLNSMHPRPQHMSAIYLGMTLSQLEAEGYSIFVVRPLARNDAQAVDSTVEPAIASNPVKESPTPAAELETTSRVKEISSTTSTITESSMGTSAPLTDRQEMERLRRQRIEERERAAAATTGATQPSSSSSSSSATPTTVSSHNKRANVDHDHDAPERKEAKRSPGNMIVTTPSFLPRCEADTLAATMTLEDTPEVQSNGPNIQVFTGEGNRLGGTTSSQPTDTDFGQLEGENDAEWKMMQQAIAMSLQGNPQ